MRLAPFLVPFVLALSVAGCAARPTRDEDRAAQIEQGFIGRFAGTVETRDPASGARRSQRLTMEGTPRDGGGVDLAFVVEAGEGASTTRHGAIAVDPVARTLTYSTDDGRAPQRLGIELWASFTGLGELIANGRGADAGTRIVFSIGVNRLAWQRTVRPPGGAAALDERYTLLRQRR